MNQKMKIDENTDSCNKADFNYQNVLQSLETTEIPQSEGEKPKFEILFEGIFGVSAKFYCEAISVESVEPFVP